MTVARSLALTLTVMGALALVVSAQQPAPTPGPTAASTAPTFAPDFAPLVAWSQQARSQNRSSELAKEYVKAEKESEKREIRQKMTDALNEQFDEHMKQQEAELAELEKQIADLRAVLKKRSSAKGTIVDQRIEQLIREADGLGWTAPGNPNPYFGRSYSPDSAYRAPKAATPKKP
jgi:septal ring factor EnvC (AmiA/AmiB activator)